MHGSYEYFYTNGHCERYKRFCALFVFIKVVLFNIVKYFI